MDALRNLCASIEILPYTHKHEELEKEVVEMIKSHFDNKVSISFEGIKCKVVIKATNQQFCEDVGSEYYGLWPFVVGEMQTSALYELLSDVEYELLTQPQG